MNSLTVNDVFVSGGHVVAYQNLDVIHGDVPIFLPVKDDYQVTYTAPPMPKALLRQVLSFCKWSYDEHKCEAQVRLYTNDAGDWMAVVPPQEISSGLFTKELTSHADRDEAFKDTEGFSQIGTIHHHCSIDAFQSGTDHKDEVDQNQEGIHITFGHMDKEMADFHARVVFRKLSYPEEGVNFHLADWIHEPEQDMLKLTDLPEFPEEWKTRMIERPVYTPAKYTTYKSTGKIAWKPDVNTSQGVFVWDYDTQGYISREDQDRKRRARNTQSQYAYEKYSYVDDDDEYDDPWEDEFYGKRVKALEDEPDYYEELAQFEEEMRTTNPAHPIEPGQRHFDNKEPLDWRLERESEDTGLIFEDQFLHTLHLQYGETGFEDYFARLCAINEQIQALHEEYKIDHPEQVVNDLKLFTDRFYDPVTPENAAKFIEDHCIDWEETFQAHKYMGYVPPTDNKETNNSQLELIPAATDGEQPQG